MVKRHGRSAFMPSVHVFPGGRVDPEDAALAATLPDDTLRHAAALLDSALPEVEAGAYAVAAIRETAEECGLLLALDAAGRRPDAAVARDVFHALRQGASFAGELARHGLTPAFGDLHALAWWITPDFEPRQYDTRFFLAEAPEGQQATIDAVEVTEGRWLTPSTTLAAFREGTLVLAPPTLATLEMLAAGGTPEATLSAVIRPIRPIRPVLAREAGTPVLALPGDTLFPEPGPAALPHRTRFRVGDEFDPDALKGRPRTR